jgi:hypothetical protein
MQTTSWADVVASGAAVAAAASAQAVSTKDLLVPRHMATNTSGVLCCSKQADSDNIPWEQCAPRDIMAVNYTALAAAVL